MLPEISTPQTPSSDCHLFDAAYQMSLCAAHLACAWFLLSRYLTITWQTLPGNYQAAKHMLTAWQSLDHCL